MTATQKTTLAAALILTAGVVSLVTVQRSGSSAAGKSTPAAGDPVAAPPGSSSSIASKSRREAGTPSAAQAALAEKYGASRTRIAYEVANRTAVLAQDLLEIDRSPSWIAEQRQSRQFLLERLAGELGLSEDQRAALLELLPEWETQAVAQTTQLAEAAGRHPDAIAEMVLAVDAWDRGETPAEELVEVANRSGTTLQAGGGSVLEWLELKAQRAGSGDPFETFPGLAGRLEQSLDAAQRARYQEMRQADATAAADPSAFTRQSLEQISTSIARRAAQTRLMAEDHASSASSPPSSLPR